MRFQFRSTLIWALAIAVFAVGFPVADLHAGTISCEILQHQLDRLYFSRGEESLVLPGARFRLLCGVDTVGGGLIEWSRPGIAVSEVMLIDSTLDSCTALTALIAVPDVDSSSRIYVGLAEESIRVFGIAPSPILLDPFGNIGILGHTRAGNEIWRDSLSAGSTPGADVTMTFAGTDSAKNAENGNIIVEAPFIAALVPNLSKAANELGFLTTSAYYRFGDINLPYLFPGMKSIRQDRFDRQDSSSTRLYSFDPQRGRGLLGGIDDLPDTLKIAYGDGLGDAAHFFADVLSRDRLKVVVTDFDTTADLSLMWIRYLESDPVAAARSLLAVFSHQQPQSDSQREALALIEQYLQLAAASASDDARDYYLNLVDRSFKEDLGAFPLFRPSIAISSADRLRNVRTDVDGRLLISELVLLSYPPNDSIEIKK